MKLLRVMVLAGSVGGGLHSAMAQPSPNAGSAAGPTCAQATDQPNRADVQALSLQSQKASLRELAKALDEAIRGWQQATELCEGHPRERAVRNLADSRRLRDTVSEQLSSGTLCESAHQDASAVQKLAQQAVGERRWSDASLLFRKAGRLWDVASERCSGTLQQQALAA